MRMRGAALFVVTLLALPLAVWLLPPSESLFPFWAAYLVLFSFGIWKIQNMRLRGFALVVGAFLAFPFVSYLWPCEDCGGSGVPAYLLWAMSAAAFLIGVWLLVRGRRR